MFLRLSLPLEEWTAWAHELSDLGRLHFPA